MEEEKLNSAIEAIGKALQNSPDEEKAFLMELKNQIEAVSPDEKLDRRLEFCYGIVYNEEKIKNPKLIKAARQYIDIIEGKS
jgi:hypothetical protein